MKLDKHNRKMIGLKKVAGETRCLRGYYANVYGQLFYDTETGKVWLIPQSNSSWTVYDNDAIKYVSSIYSPTTMQELADMIDRMIHILEVSPHECFFSRSKPILSYA